MNDKETVEEFLARGGKITEVPFGHVTDRDGTLSKGFTVRRTEEGLSLKVLRNVRVSRQKSRRGLYK